MDKNQEEEKSLLQIIRDSLKTKIAAYGLAASMFFAACGDQADQGYDIYYPDSGISEEYDAGNGEVENTVIDDDTNIMTIADLEANMENTDFYRINSDVFSYKMRNKTDDIYPDDPAASWTYESSAIDTACRTWAAQVLGIQCFHMSPNDGRDPMMEIYFLMPEEFGQKCTPGAIACATYPYGGPMYLRYNDGYKFVLDNENARGGSSGYDLQTISLHELGHSFGLPHIDDKNSVMYFQYQGPRRELTEVDIRAIKALYKN